MQFCCKFVLDTCLDDLEFITERFDPNALSRVRTVAHTPFKRLSYTEAIEVLQEHIKNGKVFENGVGESDPFFFHREGCGGEDGTRRSKLQGHLLHQSHCGFDVLYRVGH